MKSPCYKCPDRYPNCHDFCEEYQAFKERRQEIHKARTKVNGIDDYFIGAVQKVKKRRRQHS